jgi:A/G-specific adenine glycosylase
MQTELSFSKRVLSWAADHGRRQLPWQQQRTAYRVWVSEIMLQQTQVDTVIPYFQKFMQIFPSIEKLANAKQDKVLHYWSGLGYYARARNLHKAAQLIRDSYDGVFPTDIDDVVALPGIGRSTAGAILSLSFNQKHTILDGNVKRVLARHQAVEGWPGSSANVKILWAIADKLTPKIDCADYTQAMMDLGATLCKRSKPQCESCPVSTDCIALKKGMQNELPHSKPKKQIPTRKTVMLAVTSEQTGLLMQRRPNQGIWGGLWSFPEFDSEESALDWCTRTFQQAPQTHKTLDLLTHTFSHFRLQITPVSVKVSTPIHWVMEADEWVWYKHGSSQVGLAAPVDQLIKQLAI